MASRITARARTAIQVVWVTDQGDVFSAEFGAASEGSFDIMAAEHIGTYTMLAMATDIEEDLRVVLRARACEWLVDGESVS